MTFNYCQQDWQVVANILSKLMTTTISCQKSPMKAKLVQNLKVLDLDENKCVALTQCFSIKSLPVSNSQIPSNVDLSS